MKLGVSYMGHHNPKHLKTDLEEMKQLRLDDVLVAAQENDFVHFTGKLEFTPPMAKDLGIRPVAIFWGALNLFGGGRSSQFLLDHSDSFQVAKDGSHRDRGCYMNAACRRRIEEMIDTVCEHGFEGYFVDEPCPLTECFCPSCRATFEEWYQADLMTADEATARAYRERCVIDYVAGIANYCQKNHPDLETMCCLTPKDKSMWEAASKIDALDNLGTDIYWVNEDHDVEGMAPLLRDMAAVCKKSGKIHHEWLQCWQVKEGREQRVLDQGKILVRERPDSLYVWAWEGQIGTTETCHDPEKAWSLAREVFRLAKEGEDS